MEELEEVLFSLDKLRKFVKIRKILCEPLRTKLIEFIWAHKGDFAWTHHEIMGIDPSIMFHRLNVDLEAKPVKHNRRSFKLERYTAINTEVDKLIEAESIQEAQYPK